MSPMHHLDVIPIFGTYMSCIQKRSQELNPLKKVYTPNFGKILDGNLSLDVLHCHIGL